MSKTAATWSLVAMIAAGCASAQPAGKPTEHVEPWQWQKWKPVGVACSYYNVLPRGRDGRLQLWVEGYREGVNTVELLTGKDLGSLERKKTRFDAKIISGYDRHKKGPNPLAHPIMSRSVAGRMNDGSYVVVTNVGPRYTGGDTELYPIILTSPTGQPGTWKQIGTPAGEPKAWLDAASQAGRRIRCEGGGIFQMPNGTYRLYIQGFGKRMTLAKADSLEGPWTFEKDAKGQIRDLLAGLDAGGGWLFPQVMRIGKLGWMITGGNTWPPVRITAAVSADGIWFRIPTDKQLPRPWLTPGAVKASGKIMKCLRGAYDPQTGWFEAAANIWDRPGRRWVLYHSRCKLDASVFADAGR